MTTSISSLSDHEREVLGRIPSGLLIGGEWRQAAGGGTVSVEDPATGLEIAQIADGTADDARAALDAAHAAQATMAALSPRERSDILQKTSQLLTEHTEELALLMTLELGKPLEESRGEVAYGASFFWWFAGEAVRLAGEYKTSADGKGRTLVQRQPVGPCLFITPWNFPLAMGARKLAPAIAAGCPSIVKPAKLTPLTMLRLAQLLEEAGLPAGGVNVITASSARAVTEPLIGDRRLRKLSFTGSTEVGQKLVESAAGNLLRVSMELGGNAPLLVFDDADLDVAVEGAYMAKMRNGGEACTAANRILVQRGIADAFTAKFVERMSAVKVGRGTEDGVGLGAMVDGDQLDKIAELVDDAVDKGAKVACGGERLEGAGHFYAATVLTDVPDDARLLEEEIFGPVAPIRVFDTEEQGVAEANATEYGLIAYLFTQDLARGHRVASALETGMVGLNRGVISSADAPFGGIKHSGYGREGGAEGIEEYVETKYISMPF
ncbi:MAG: NAD-dependent succinate-semialdehyde dehydrogenase [Patulibacter minatonensis]